MLLKFSVAPGNILFQRSGALRFFTAPDQYALSSRFLNPAASFVSSAEAAGLKGGSLRFAEHIVPSL